MYKQKLLSILFTLLIGLTLKVKAQDHTNAFITIWDTQYMTIDGLTIPSEGIDYEYYWEKVGSESSVNSGPDYKTNSGYLTLAIAAKSGVYKIYIKGSYTKITMSGNNNSNRALTTVQSWGNIQWSSMMNAFRGCANLATLPLVAPNLSSVTSMESMFRGAAAFNQDISNWDVSTITNMSGMFLSATAFNQNIGSWDVSKVDNMSSMFSGATAFNQYIGGWKLNSAVNMSSMLNNSGLSSSNYGLILRGWADEVATPNSRNLGATGLKYTSVGKTYRDNLTKGIADGGKGWSISGDGLDETLSVALDGFTAIKQGATVKLGWKTLTETNNSYFDVQRSLDGIVFLSIGKIKGNGTIAAVNNYSFTDYNPNAGVNYYRLANVDKDGGIELSDMRTLQFASTSVFKAWPNPLEDTLYITLPTATTVDTMVRIFDSMGLRVLEQNMAKGAVNANINLSRLPTGIYFVKYGQQAIKVVKK